MKLLQLGQIEKGSLLPDARYKSLSGRWFDCKKMSGNREEGGSDGSLVGNTVGRDTLVKLKCMRVKLQTMEHYRVLCLFSKYNNKWFVHWDDERVVFSPGLKKYKMLVRMVSKEPGNEVREVDLEKDGDWGPKSIYSMRYVGDIVSIEGELGNAYSW
jgi:hypothetical protein